MKRVFRSNLLSSRRKFEAPTSILFLFSKRKMAPFFQQIRNCTALETNLFGFLPLRFRYLPLYTCSSLLKLTLHYVCDGNMEFWKKLILKALDKDYSNYIGFATLPDTTIRARGEERRSRSLDSPRPDCRRRVGRLSTVRPTAGFALTR